MNTQTTRKPLQILLVEDSRHDRLAFRRTCAQSEVPCVITECVRAEEALGLLANTGSAFDLVVSDHQLPGMSGIELYKAVDADDRVFAFVLMTGAGTEYLAVIALKMGIDEYLIKDADQRYLELLPVVLQQVRRRHEDRLARRLAETMLRRSHEELERLVHDRTIELTDANAILREQVAERRRAEAALRQAEEKYRGIFENAVEGIFQMTPAGRFLTVNPALTRILGYETPDELTAWITNVCEHLYVDSQRGAEVQRILHERGVVQGMELQLYHKNKRTLWVSMNVRAVHDSNGTLLHYEGTMVDITERKRGEEEKRQLQEQLFQTQKLEAVGTLAGGIAHDFSNLLTIILGFGKLLEKAIHADPIARDHVEEILNAGNRAKELVHQLLTFSRPGQQARRPVELHTVVADALGLLRAVVPTTVELRSSLASAGDVVLANANQIHQVIMNLGVNALQAMRDTGGVLEVRLEPAVVTSAMTRVCPSLLPGSYYKLIVSDTGCGMTPEVKARIFDPFFSTKPAGEGSGLGLSVVHGIIHDHGGTITVDSCSGHGTTFVIYLPQSTAVVPPPDPVALPSQSESMRRVLFADDEKAGMHKVRQMLED